MSRRVLAAVSKALGQGRSEAEIHAALLKKGFDAKVATTYIKTAQAQPKDERPLTLADKVRSNDPSRQFGWFGARKAAADTEEWERKQREKPSLWSSIVGGKKG